MSADEQTEAAGETKMIFKSPVSRGYSVGGVSPPSPKRRAEREERNLKKTMENRK